MMKKVFSVVLMTVSVLSAQGVNLGKVLDPPDFMDGHAHWIVRVGIGINGTVGSTKSVSQKSWEHDKWDGSYKPTIGYDFSFGFNKTFGQNPLYWGMSLGLGMRGYKTEAQRYGDTGIIGTSHGNAGSNATTKNDDSLNSYNVQLSPFTIGYKYTFMERMAVDLHIGAFVSYDFAGKYKSHYVKDVHYYAGKDTHDEKESEIKISDLDTYRKHDYGMVLGVGYWYGHFNIDLSWQRGFVPLFEGSDEELKIGKETFKRGNLFSNNFQIKLGYSF